MDGYDGDAISDQEWDGADQERLDDIFPVAATPNQKVGKTMRVWITKYALTQGIFEREAEQCLDIRPDGAMIQLTTNPGNYIEFYHKPDWQETREAAVTRAHVMRKAKLASLKKQISRLEALSFDD